MPLRDPRYRNHTALKWAVWLAVAGCRGDEAAQLSRAELPDLVTAPDDDRARRPPEAESRKVDEPSAPAIDAYDREMRLGDAALYSGRFEVARQHFLNAMGLRVDSMSPALGAIRSMLIRGAADARREIAERVERRVAQLRADERTRGSGHLLAARLALALGEHGAALDAAYLAVIELPELGAAWRVLGEAAMADEHWGDAVRALRRALELGVQAEAGTWERLADALDEAGDLEAAEDAARKAVTLTGDDTHAQRRRLNLLAIVQKHRGHLEVASETVQQAWLLGADDPAVLHNLGSIAEARGKLDEALAHYQKATAETPSPMTFWRIGKLHLKMERPNEAVQAMIRASAHLDRWTWPASLRWWPAFEVGKLWSRAGRFDEAIGWFEDALREALDGESQREVRSWLAWCRARSEGHGEDPAPLMP
jgi:tetratricopeptide (TPR) repeat protein